MINRRYRARRHQAFRRFAAGGPYPTTLRRAENILRRALRTYLARKDTP